MYGASHVVKQSNSPLAPLLPIPKPLKFKGGRRSTLTPTGISEKGNVNSYTSQLLSVIVRTRSNTDGSRMQRNDSLTEDTFRPIMTKGRADSISRIINDSASNDPDDPSRQSDNDSIKSSKGNRFPFSTTGQSMKGNRLSMWYGIC